MLDIYRSLAFLAPLEVALLVLDDALHFFKPFLNLPVLRYGLQYIGYAM